MALFHLVAKRQSLRLQGFLGGFVSSTAVYVHVLNGGFLAAAVWFERHTTPSLSAPLAPLASVSESPVAWFSVAKFSAVILALIVLLEYVAQEFTFYAHLSATLIALFEAHAVLAASVSEWSQSGNTTTGMTLFLLILLGNTLGKSLLIWRSENLTRKLPLQAVLWVTYAATLAVTVSLIR